MDPNAFGPPPSSAMPSRPQPMPSYSGGYGRRPSNIWAIVAIIFALLFIGALVFALVEYSGKKSAETDVSGKIYRAVVTAKQDTAAEKEAEFAERVKSPLRTYAGPQAYGSVTISYPASWSSYVIDDNDSSPFVDGYFYPQTVPDIGNEKAAFALRVQIVSQSYDNVLKQIAQYTKKGTTTIKPYKAPKVPSVIGSEVTGQIDSDRQGTMVIFQIRDKTLKIWTESPRFQADFDKYILPNFTFLP